MTNWSVSRSGPDGINTAPKRWQPMEWARTVPCVAFQAALWSGAAAPPHFGRPLKELAAELPGECVCLSEAELGLLDTPGASTSAVAAPGTALRGGARESGLVSCTVPCARSRRRLRVGGGRGPRVQSWTRPERGIENAPHVKPVWCAPACSRNLKVPDGRLAAA